MKMNNLPVLYRGVCNCGDCQVEVLGKPFVTGNCHCSICQKNFQKDYNTVCVFWEPAVSVKGPVKYEISNNCWKGLVGVNRGICCNCNQLFYGYGTRLYTGIVFVPRDFLSCDPNEDVTNNKKSALEATVNVYYASGKQKDDMGLLTMYSDLASFLFGTWVIVKAVPSLLIFYVALLVKNPFKTKQK